MKATASLWNQGKLEFFITGWDIPRDVAFADVAWVYSIRTGLWLFMTIVILLLSWTCLPMESSVASFFASLMSHTDVVFAHLHWSILATWLSHFYLRFWTTATMSFVLVLCLTSEFVTLSLHTACSIICSTFRWQVWSILFSLFVSDLFWAPYIRARNMLDSRTAFLSPVFGVCWPV